MTAVNWDQVRDEAVKHLQALVRFDTSNPPGNELGAAEYLAGILTAESLAPRVLKSTPTRGNLVARLKSTGVRPPLMLMGHLDVVPAVPEAWQHAPFGGALVDGFVWGRGTLDCKGVVVSHFMTVLLVHRLGLPLQGDLVYLAHADEESDFAYGIGWLARNHRDLFDAPYALYEGAGEELAVAGKCVRTVATAEKGWCTVDVVTRGQGGHSSVPHGDNPLFHMAPVLSRLQANPMPIHVTATAARFFTTLGALYEPEAEMGVRLRQLADETTAAAALSDLTRLPDPKGHGRGTVDGLPGGDANRAWLNAMLRNTAVPTMMQGSNSRWALPSEAHLTLNGRALPGQSEADYDRELRAILGAETEYRIEDFHPGSECALDSPVLQAIQRVMARQSPHVPLIPVMMAGGCERGLLKELGVDTYGFWPRRAEAGVPPALEMAHGVDERLSAENLLYSIQCLFEIVCDLNGVRLPV